MERKRDEDNKASEKHDNRREFMNISFIDQGDLPRIALWDRIKAYKNANDN